jgi:hypothetical protein
MQPFIAVRVIKMPVGVDQMSDWLRAYAGERLGNPRARSGDAGVYQKFAIAAGEHGNVAARAIEDSDIAAKFGNRDFGPGRRVANDDDRTFVRLPPTIVAV